MKKLLGLIVLLWVAAWAGPADPVFNDINEIAAVLSRITGWKMTRQVPADIIRKDQLRSFLEHRVKEVVSPEELRIEEITLKMFGLVPQDFDMAKTTVDLLSEQAAAFYDQNKRRLFILESTDTESDKRLALVHEMAHALADQNFHLNKYIQQGSKSDDGATARQAVMEGQATWLMWAYVAKTGGGAAEVPDAMLAALGNATEAAATNYPVFSSAPLYLRESLVFPYTRGLIFQNAVYKKMGQAGFSEVFRHPPVSTQQILHPEAYLAGVRPTLPEPESPPNLRQFRRLAAGNVGEFDHSILLRQYAGEQDADSTAPHWKGGSYALFEHKKAKYPVLSYVSDWDSPAIAHQYFVLYRQVLERKWKKFDILEDTQTRIAGSGDSGKFVLTLDGTRVSSIEGLR